MLERVPENKDKWKELSRALYRVGVVLALLVMAASAVVMFNFDASAFALIFGGGAAVAAGLLLCADGCDHVSKALSALEALEGMLDSPTRDDDEILSWIVRCDKRYGAHWWQRQVRRIVVYSDRPHLRTRLSL